MHQSVAMHHIEQIFSQHAITGQEVSLFGQEIHNNPSAYFTNVMTLITPAAQI